MMWINLTICLVASSLLVKLTDGSVHAKKLFDDLLLDSGYNKMVRPVGNNTDVLAVEVGLRLSQLLDINERNQIMSTNVWLQQAWVDHKLKWDPTKYGGVDKLYVPSDEIWVPDIVLYNNADGNYMSNIVTKAKIHHTGRVEWDPLVIYKSSCTIDVEFFPFDIQHCYLKFSVWSYDGTQVDLMHKNYPNATSSHAIPEGIDMTRFTASSEWDVLEVPGRRNIEYYPCCPEPYPDITFNMTLRRKPLFYTVNLIAPCFAISILTGCVFYLPSDSKKKMTMCISIFVALTVFVLLLTDLMPPTSLVTPLIGKFLILTMALVTCSIFITVVVLNIHCRGPGTHEMSSLCKTVFLVILPKMLMFPRPIQARGMYVRSCNIQKDALSGSSLQEEESIFGSTKRRPGGPNPYSEEESRYHECSKELSRVMNDIKYIADNMEAGDIEKQVREDWKFVAMVIDRLFLWIFTGGCFVGSAVILLGAETLYDTREAFPDRQSN